MNQWIVDCAVEINEFIQTMGWINGCCGGFGRFLKTGSSCQKGPAWPALGQRRGHVAGKKIKCWRLLTWSWFLSLLFQFYDKYENSVPEKSINIKALFEVCSVRSFAFNFSVLICQQKYVIFGGKLQFIWVIFKLFIQLPRIDHSKRKQSKQTKNSFLRCAWLRPLAACDRWLWTQ